jgi:hypothetical protein
MDSAAASSLEGKAKRSRTPSAKASAAAADGKNAAAVPDGEKAAQQAELPVFVKQASAEKREYSTQSGAAADSRSRRSPITLEVSRDIALRDA